MNALPTLSEAESQLRQRLVDSRKRQHRRIPDRYLPVVKSLIKKGESKKAICLLFGISYATLKSELNRSGNVQAAPGLLQITERPKPMKTLTKADFQANIQDVIREHYADGDGRLKKASGIVLEAIIDTITEQLCQGNRVSLINYGSLCPYIKPGGRPVRNPKTGEEMPMFDTVSIRFKRAFNGKGPASKFNTGQLIKAIEPTLGELGLPCRLAAPIVRQGFIAMLRRTTTGEYRSEIRLFGSFGCKWFEPATKRNPKIGCPVELEGRWKPTFRASRALIRRANATLLTELE